jgi:hypothetical protein
LIPTKTTAQRDSTLPFIMSRLRHRDRYADGYLAGADKPYWPVDAVPGDFHCIIRYILVRVRLPVLVV